MRESTEAQATVAPSDTGAASAVAAGVTPAAVTALPLSARADLVRRAREGDRIAFERLVDRWIGPAFRSALAILGHEADARDATQDALLDAWRNIRQLRAAEDHFQLGVSEAGITPLKMGMTGMSRFSKAMAVTEPFHKLVEGPHWYLVNLGTRTARQGQGLGSQLVEMGTSRADEAGLPCYLETATDVNIAFYEKRGFEIMGQGDCLGHTLTGMVRRPR